MRKLMIARSIFNGGVLINVMIFAIAYFGDLSEDLILLLVCLNMLFLVILPIVCICVEVKIILKTKINIISIILLLFNILIFLLSASYYGSIF
jgi:hypothetical protein